MSRRLLVTAALSTAATVALSGCFLFPQYDTPVIGGEDVRMQAPGSEGFRAAGEKGEVYTMVQETAADANGWVSDTVEDLADLITTLNQYPEDRRDGKWREYGPYVDEDGYDLSWIVRIEGEDGEHASFEVLVGNRKARGDGDMIAVMWGDIVVEDSMRSGGFAIDFEAFEAHPDLKDDEDEDTIYAGEISVSFLRDVDTELKVVEMDFDGFVIDDGKELVDFADEKYVYDRDKKGAGRFHLAAWGAFEEDGLSGPELERMQIDVRWDHNEAGRALGQIEQLDGEGDLKLGDLEVHECFDPDGTLTWRWLSDAYQPEVPGYVMGDESGCIFKVSDLAPSPARKG